jgi:hypothetical protein
MGAFLQSSVAKNRNHGLRSGENYRRRGGSKLVRLAFLWRPAVIGADNDMVLEAAVNGRADALVTFNTRDFGKTAEGFGIEVIPPGEAIRRLEVKG